MTRILLTTALLLWGQSCVNQVDRGETSARREPPSPAIQTDVRLEAFVRWATTVGVVNPGSAFSTSPDCTGFSECNSLPRSNVCCRSEFCEGTFGGEGWIAELLWLEASPDVAQVALRDRFLSGLSCHSLGGSQLGRTTIDTETGSTWRGRVCYVNGCQAYLSQRDAEGGEATPTAVFVFTPSFANRHPVEKARYASIFEKAGISGLPPGTRSGPWGEGAPPQAEVK